MKSSGIPPKCRLVCRQGELPPRVFEFEAEDYHQRAHEILQQNPPGPTVETVILETPFMHYVGAGGFVSSFSWEAYHEALDEQKFRDGYFKRTGKHWQKQPAKEHHKQTAPEVPSGHVNLTLEQCLSILGLKPGFSPKDLKHAYSRAVKMNHPDKVASLSPEFTALAEKRTKQINQAYAKLKRSK
jgi:hypothetical protein